MMHKYQIDKFRAVFKSKVTEARYFESIVNEIIPEVKQSFIIGLSVFWLYSIADFLFFNKETFTFFLFLKLIPTFSTLALILTIKKIKSSKIFYTIILFNLFVFLGFVVFFFIAQPTEPLQMALTQMVVIMGVTLLIPNTFVYSMLISIISSIVFAYIDILKSTDSMVNSVIIISSFISYNIFIFQFILKAHLVQRLKFIELHKEQKYIRVLNKEILKRIALEKKLTKMASIDSLTGACNRRNFIDIAEHEKRKSHRFGTNLSLILIDIDDFKAINDTYGHATGDLALKKFMKICKSTLRDSDVIGRMGGEEFAILCIDSDKKQTEQIASRLCKNIYKNTAKLQYRFTISLGVCEIKPEYKTIDKALHLADLALYEAKKGGKNCVKIA
ncbi:MAG: GGDEF domain-containing protein [Spirochaetia bacterium]|nr:GGDEF domain-containing protein [Spirochaetia bacterium]